MTLSLVPIKIAESLQFKSMLIFKLFTNQTFCLQIKKKSKKFIQNFFVKQGVKSNEQQATSKKLHLYEELHLFLEEHKRIKEYYHTFRTCYTQK